MTPIDTGYDDSGPPKEDGPVIFKLEQYRYQHSASIIGRLLRNDTAIGMLYFKTEEELEWMRRRIDGEYDAEKEQEIEQRNLPSKDQGETNDPLS